MNEIMSGAALLGKKQRYAPLIILYLVIFLQIIIILLMCFFYVTVTDGESMENTLQDKQLFIVQRIAYTVKHGDIVTINTANDGEDEHILIKRVIGLSGDRILYMKSEGGGHIDIYRRKKGASYYEMLDEPYIKAKMSLSANYFGTSICSYISNFTNIDFSSNPVETARYEKSAILIPDDNIYFLGDNRNESLDSRLYGVRSLKFVKGKLVKTVDRNGSTEKFLKFIFSINI